MKQNYKTIFDMLNFTELEIVPEIFETSKQTFRIISFTKNENIPDDIASLFKRIQVT